MSSSWVRFQFTTKSITAFGSAEAKQQADRLSYTDLVALNRYEGGEEPGTPPRGDRRLGSSSSPSRGTHSAVIDGDRIGLFATVDSFDQLPSLFANVLEKLPEGNSSNTYVNVIHIVLMRGLLGGAAFDDDCSALLGGFLASQKVSLKARRVRRVTFMVGQQTTSLWPLGLLPSSLSAKRMTSARTDFSVILRPLMPSIWTSRF